MSTLEEVRRMKSQGIPEDQMIKTLQEKGIPYKDISEALAQSKIKAAVENSIQDPNTNLNANQFNGGMPPIPPQAPQTAEEARNFPQPPETIQGMQQSILQTAPREDPAAEEYVPPPPTAPQEGFQGGYDAYGGQYDYQPYEYPPSGISPDTITEISEQVVAERMTEMRKHLNKITDFKTVIEAKTESIEERLRRLEETIHALQSSVLRKVGDYVTNVDDIKKELIATQKTFTKMSGKHILHKPTKHHKKKSASKK